MAAAASSLLTDAQADSRRARELYKYYIPQSSAYCTTQNTLPDTVLTSHAQLVAWRLNCQRAMVSLIDRETQYFVAESTKTLDLNDHTQHDDPSDAIWAGCISVPKAGRLCEHTIQELPRSNGDPPLFEVLDLTKDNRFNTLPFVVEAPFFKYYTGVPLRTKKGIAIGSLFALDDKVREPLSRSNRMFLATMAENVMSHYENIKEKEDRKRSLHMNMCLAAFVDPENQIKKPKRRTSTHSKRHKKSKSVASVKSNEVLTSTGAKPFLPTGSSIPSAPASQHGSDHHTEASNTTSLPSKRVDEDDHIETFQRAADLLHDSLSLQSGGVVFMDTSTSYRSRRRQTRLSDESRESSDGSESGRVQAFTRRGSVGATTFKSASSWGPSRMADPPEVTPTGNKPTEVLAYSPSVQPSHSTLQDPSFTPLANDEIERLIKRHPRGKLFHLDPEGIIASSSDGDEYPATYEVPKATKLTPSKVEAGLLSKHFPGARQVIFLPLWDSSASRFSTFFAYTTSEFRTFSNNPDFLHCIAFCNCVMTEITRLATTAADQQKSDFIGSVSHELRSPLHGILASCEFLGDTETSSFQKSLIDTADSCARTLLDTINMVLDYSKINAFERNATKARRKKGQVGTGTMESSGQPQLNIYGDVDLAAITEEVVEGVATGQVFKDSLTGVDAIDLTSDVSKQSVPGKKDVEIILDISPRASPKDWVFITQPGAFRRIIMNIFGNSLKYTRQGFIRVKLEAQSPAKHKGDTRDPPPATIVRLTITDTGQGMSPQFMRTKLYTPFAQENSIAPGTGLGLSLVKSMVTMLNGEINIHSAVGIGTEVTVKFPMTLSGHNAPGGSSSGTSGSTPSSAGSIERIKDESLQIVQLKAQGKKAMLFPDKSAQKSLSESSRMIRDAINRYLTGWFGFEVTYPLSKTNLPDIIITDEADLPELLNVLPNALTGDRGPMVIVLCTATSRRSNAYMISKSERFEAVSHPFGPYKLAKTIRVCLDRLERIAIVESESEGMGLTPIAPSEEEDFDAAEVAIAVQQMTISNPDPGIPDVTVIKAGTVVAHGDSIHAQLLSDNEPTSMSGGSQEAPEYPFPAEDGTISPSNLPTVETERPQLASRRTISPTTTEIANTARVPEPATPVSSKGALANDLPTKLAEPIANAPRMLLVDDNSVNLRLLQTFMKKRKYNDIFSAEDGQQAVSVYRNLLTSTPPRPPDIIFMDISMPVMNGFEATRRIREIEADFRAQFPSPMVTPPSALIIALTGLASGRDQSEAFTSGFDLYLVKPISFREVGRLLDNWEKSGGGASVGVPHGPAVAPVEGKENMPGAGAGGDLMDLPPA